MKRKHLIISAFTLMALLGAGVGTAFAFGGSEFGGGMGLGMGMTGRNADPATVAERFNEQVSWQANLLGVSIDEMKSYWAQGKTMQDIIKEKGLSEADLQAKMLAARAAEQKTFLQTLVDKGAITQAQADSRLKIEQDRSSKSTGKFMGMGGRQGHGRIGTASK